MSFCETLKSCRLLRVLLLLSSTLCISSCDLIFDEILDCIDDDQPEIRGALPNPVLNQYYEEGVSVSIRNEPYDDRFKYTFEFTGNLPQGIQTETADRSFRLVGTPIETGDYQFSISVKVEDEDARAYLDDSEDDTSGLCSTYDAENFQWTIQLM